MHPNSTSFTFIDHSFTRDVSPSSVCAPTAPLLHQLHTGIQRPSIKSKPAKYAGVPDRPNRTAMRARRAESEMAISVLRNRTETAVKIDFNKKKEQHKLVKLINTDYETENQKKQKTELISYQSGYSVQIIQSIENFFDYLFTTTALNFKPFSDHYSKDFEIWRNTLAHRATTTKGLVFVFGEKHRDSTVASLIAGVMMSIDPKFETGCLFQEGTYSSCSSLETGLRLRPGYCQSMEKDSEIYIKLNQMRAVVLSKAKACAEFVQQNLRLSVDTMPSDFSYPYEYEKYVNQHFDQLPFFARVVLEPMIKDYNDMNTQWELMRRESIAPRDQYMANKVRQGRTHDGPNFVVVGSAHLHGLREQLNDLPCIFMNPKKVAAEFPNTTLREGPLNVGSKNL